MTPVVLSNSGEIIFTLAPGAGTVYFFPVAATISRVAELMTMSKARCTPWPVLSVCVAVNPTRDPGAAWVLSTSSLKKMDT